MAFFKQLKTISLNKLDRVFLIGFTVLVIWLCYNGITILTLGGIVLIYGSFLTYKGQIFLSAFSYIVADICWIYNAWL